LEELFKYLQSPASEKWTANDSMSLLEQALVALALDLSLRSLTLLSTVASSLLLAGSIALLAAAAKEQQKRQHQ
jgi:hypothetical protein